jgi:hypothetical protein
MDTENPQTGQIEGKTPQSQQASQLDVASEIIARRLLPLALEVYEDLMVHGKSEKVRLDAANAVSELRGLRSKSVTSLGLTFNMPPEYLSKALKGLSKLKLDPQEEVLDLENNGNDQNLPPDLR